jgi:hypothetical protein
MYIENDELSRHAHATKDRVFSMLSLTGGISIPSEFEGLPRIQTSVVDHQTLAVLYSDAKGQWIDNEERRQLVPDPSGEAVIVFFHEDGSAKPTRRFRIQSAWIVFAVGPNGNWVVGRTRRRIGSGDVNDTTIYNAKGGVVRAFDVGGHIAFIQAGDDGSIWIGHDDDDPEPDLNKLGGISLFAPDGSELFYHNLSGLPDTPTDDGTPFWCCYALNVIGRSAWAQHYTSMHITRFEPDGTAKSWATEYNGAVALAIKDSVVARIGRYDDNRYKISVFHLKEPPQSDWLGTSHFDIEGQKPKFIDCVDGKEDTFHIVHDNKWYRITTDDILARLPTPQ